jgi:ketosteroid isomerase-like protein
MSQENVARVRQALERFNAGHRVDYELLHPDVVWRNHGEAPDVGGQSHAGLEKWIAEMEESFENMRSETDEFIDAGDAVISIGRLVATGRGSAAEVSLPLTSVWRFRDGMVVSVDSYSSTADALEAAGVAG